MKSKPGSGKRQERNLEIVVNQIAASGTGAPFCWLKLSKSGRPGAETSTGWRSFTMLDRCLQA